MIDIFWGSLLSHAEEQLLIIIKELIKNDEVTTRELAKKLAIDPKTVQRRLRFLQEEFPSLILLTGKNSYKTENYLLAERAIEKIYTESDLLVIIASVFKNQPLTLAHKTYYRKVERINRLLLIYNIYLKPKQLVFVGDEFRIRQLLLLFMEEFPAFFNSKKLPQNTVAETVGYTQQVKQLIQFRTACGGSLDIPKELLQLISNNRDFYNYSHGKLYRVRESFYAYILERLADTNQIYYNFTELPTPSFINEWLFSLYKNFPDLAKIPKNYLEKSLLIETMKLYAMPIIFPEELTKIKTSLVSLLKVRKKLQAVVADLQQIQVFAAFSSERLLAATLQVANQFLNLVTLERPVYIFIDGAFSKEIQNTATHLLKHFFGKQYHLKFFYKASEIPKGNVITIGRRKLAAQCNSQTKIFLLPEEIPSIEWIPQIEKLLKVSVRQ
ncbi:hypothetical protein M2139_002274 [Enterococcus sp. PF1-24]|uniref:helix-turn-helix domain-containing protein n=1 Tax=unclassified Enterococcus TaxID=2608891 RepID=UPI0024760055|nr:MULTISPECIES: helix-turn-helix domain-containing protein [unclassified Enterococcus]MDH6365297.1 hypothetical protein [Enterococcus sp. PFB1-1]MDH6402373.1 hypothetical protein [Enterococcus sp. PF1-24]